MFIMKDLDQMEDVGFLKNGKARAIIRFRVINKNMCNWHE